MQEGEWIDKDGLEKTNEVILACLGISLGEGSEKKWGDVFKSVSVIMTSLAAVVLLISRAFVYEQAVGRLELYGINPSNIHISENVVFTVVEFVAGIAFLAAINYLTIFLHISDKPKDGKAIGYIAIYCFYAYFLDVFTQREFGKGWLQELFF